MEKINFKKGIKLFVSPTDNGFACGVIKDEWMYSDEGYLWLCKEGNPGMATAGMGDILSGVIGALVGQGLAPRDAAIGGVWLHSRAADLAVVDDGERGLLASDLSDYLRRLVNDPYSG